MKPKDSLDTFNVFGRFLHLTANWVTGWGRCYKAEDQFVQSIRWLHF